MPATRSESMLKRCKIALKDGLKSSRPKAIFMDSHPDYVSDITDNLVPYVELSTFERDLRQGSGSELDGRGKAPPKFAAVHSSAALAVNSFAPFKTHIDDFNLLGKTRFKNFNFEHQCPIWADNIKLTPPNLDALAATDGEVVAIESKCTEFLRSKKAEFAPRYESVVEKLLDRPWLEIYGMLKSEPSLFKYLDAAQLVKHCLGLRNTFPKKDITLVYVFWEPENATDLDIFNIHRSDLKKFADLVGGSAVKFAAISYLEIWDAWVGRESPQWLLEHAEALKLRYSVVV